MLRVVFSIIFIIPFVFSNAQSSVLWAKAIGSKIGQNSAIASDASGNVFTAGTFVDTLDLDPGISTNTVVTNGYYDVFITKLDPAGNFLWGKSFGGPQFEYLNSITTDLTGNVYLAGTYDGYADFDPGPGTYTLSEIGSKDLFVVKLDPSGNFVWAKSVGPWDVRGYSIKIDVSGNVFVAGSFTGNADFDPGSGIYNILANDADIFILKLNSLGGFVWAKGIGGAYSDGAYSLALDAAGNPCITGWFKDYVDFDPGPSTYTLATPASWNENIFTLKLTSAGNFAWARSASGKGLGIGQAIAVDGAGNVYSTGYFRDTTDFDPGTGTFLLSPDTNDLGNTDVFVNKFNSLGNWQWTKQFTGKSSDYGNSICVDANNNVFVTGQFSDTLNCNSSNPAYSVFCPLPGAGAFITKMNNSGNILWVGSIEVTGSTTVSVGHCITTDVSNNLLLTGSFVNTADFDPGPNTYTLNGGNGSIFSLKFNSTVGINEINYNSSNVLVYPNPTTGCFIVEGESEMTLLIVNELGQKIQQLNLNASNNYKAHVNNLNAGVYFITSPQGKMNRKIVVIK